MGRRFEGPEACARTREDREARRPILAPPPVIRLAIEADAAAISFLLGELGHPLEPARVVQKLGAVRASSMDRIWVAEFMDAGGHHLMVSPPVSRTDALAGLLSFILPPGSPIGATFSGQFLVTDTANDTWYLDLSGSAVPEPSTLAIFILGFGGLGISALQLARRLGASEIRVVDRVPEKLAIARDLGAIVGHSGAVPNPGVRHGAAVPYNTDGLKAVPHIDVALDFAGNADLCLDALRALKPGGRLMLVAINLREFCFDA